MQIVGTLKVKDRVLTVDRVTGDPYDSIEVEVSDFEFTMPRPEFLKKEDKELHFTLQYTSSGTIALFLDKKEKVPEAADEREAARLRVLANRQAEVNKTPQDTANEVDENSDEFKIALADVKKENKEKKSAKHTGIAVKLDDDGKPISDKDA